MPRVSIGLPVHNGAQFLARALESLLNQDYPDLELLISDNASSDETEQICRDYARRDPRVQYIRQSENLGPYGNFSFVLANARGEYFMWAADDDQWAPSFIRILLDRLQSTPAAIGAFCRYRFVEEETGTCLNRIWCCDYESRFALIRLLKFTWRYLDPCIYGLMRRQRMKDIEYKPWSGINANTPYNSAYPLIYFLLARGDFLLAGEEPLWYKTVSVSRWHSTPFSRNPAVGYAAHVTRKLNLLIRSLECIHLGSRSLLLSLVVLPALVLRAIWDSLTPVYVALLIWLSGRRIDQLSPHEIWELGVR